MNTYSNQELALVLDDHGHVIDEVIVESEVDAELLALCGDLDQDTADVALEFFSGEYEAGAFGTEALPEGLVGRIARWYGGLRTAA